MLQRVSRSFTIALALCGVAVPASAQWIPEGVPICSIAGDQHPGSCLMDGAGGAILCFVYDFQSGINSGLYAERVTRSGAIAAGWPACGVPLSVTLGSVFTTSAISDGVGGAIMAWSDRRNSAGDKTYVQRITGSGTLAPGWPADPAPVVTSATDQRNVHLASDGAAGAFVTWESAEPRIYATHLNASGSIVGGWPLAGKALNPTTHGDGQSACDDGAGGAIFVWADNRNGATTGMDIYAQRLTAGGAFASGWPASGLALCTAPGQQGWSAGNSVSVADGSGGALVLWPDQRDKGLSGIDLYVQRVTSSGVLAAGWPANGAPACVAPAIPRGAGDYAMVADGTGGAFVAWSDSRSGSGYDIYSQHLMADGSVAPGWPANGLVICAAAGGQNLLALVSDGREGAIAAWMDGRNPQCCNERVYAQRVTGAGVAPAWPDDGLPVCTVGRSGAIRLASDGAGGAIVAWANSRAATGGDVYAQRVAADGGVVAVAPSGNGVASSLRVLPALPSPARGRTAVRFDLPATEVVRVVVIGLDGRRVRLLSDGVAMASGTRSLDWDGRDDSGARAPAGVYFVLVRAGQRSASGKVTLLH